MVSNSAFKVFICVAVNFPSSTLLLLAALLSASLYVCCLISLGSQSSSVFQRQLSQKHISATLCSAEHATVLSKSNSSMDTGGAVSSSKTDTLAIAVGIAVGASVLLAALGIILAVVGVVFEGTVKVWHTHVS